MTAHVWLDPQRDPGGSGRPGYAVKRGGVRVGWVGRGPRDGYAAGPWTAYAGHDPVPFAAGFAYRRDAVAAVLARADAAT